MQYDSKLFTTQGNKILNAAKDLASERNNTEVSPYHLTYVLFSDDDSLGCKILEKFNVSKQLLLQDVDKLISRLASFSSENKTTASDVKPISLLALDTDLMKLLVASKRLQTEAKDSFITVDHFLQVIYSNTTIKQVLEKNGLTLKMVTGALETARNGEDKDIESDSNSFEHLPKYGQNFNLLAEQGKIDPMIGRNDELQQTIQILCRRTKNNPVLVGLPGVGKTAVVEGLAQRIIKGDVPKSLINCRIFSLSMTMLSAGACHRGEFEERVQSVVDEVKKANGRVILFIDEVHMISGSSSSDPMNVANMLKPALSRGELRCIGCTTQEEYTKYIEKDSALERRFQKVTVNEPTIQEAISILRGLKSRYEIFHGVRILDSALVLAVQQSSRYINGRFLPDKAIDLMDEACAAVKMEMNSKPEIIDKLERQELQLSIEAMSLSSEKSSTSLMQLKLVNEKLGKIREELGPLRLQHETEKNRVDAMTLMKSKLLSLGQKLEEAERNKDFVKASELKYLIIPQLEQEIKQKGASPPLNPPGTSTLSSRETSSPLNSQESSSSPPGGKDISSSSSSSDSMGGKGGVPPADLVTGERISQIVSRWTGIPVKKLTMSDKQRLLTLASELAKTVVGQDEALNAISDSILRSRAGLSQANRPTGSFLFLGSSGTGKTQTAKALAKELFDSEKKMVRIDMSEYYDKHTINRLVGSPPGYIGYDDAGQLTEAIKRNPYCVLLFDEVEKAHPDVLNVLLQILDDGRLTSGKGKTIDFTNTIIILTSNLGSEFLLPTLDEKEEKKSVDMKLASSQVMSVVKKHFRPEFLNRLDEIVIFNPLTLDNLVNVVDILLKEISSRFVNSSTLEITPRASRHVLKQAYEPQYGARSLRRFIEKNIITKISRMVIADTFSPKEQEENQEQEQEQKMRKILIDLDEYNELIFS
jgi:ATP-dependent Clp protease ATP-binding subunit ClpB